ncbi:hemolysin family protein [Mycoplasma corogypsi]|uniref:hemolysin family protein n=1 Tax=Mycoplasma corogypsi TaxID=2106 RepID=UPI0038732214
MHSLAAKIVLLVIIILMFILSSIFSGSETAYSTISAAKLHEAVENKERLANLIQKQIKRYNQVLSTILIGNNIVNVASATVTNLLLSNIFGHDEGLVTLLTIAVVTPLLVFFGEITPKLLAKANPLRFLKVFCLFIELHYWLLFIITYPISKLTKQVYETHSEEDLKNFIKIAQTEGVIQTGESLLAQNALDLDSTKVSSHYIKMKDVSTIDYKSTVKQALELFIETNYSRIPVEKDGELIGIVLVKDIFHQNQSNRVIDYMKTVPFISANSILSSALEKLRASRSHMGFVVENNHSNTAIGIITIEDIVEEIIGEIYDEYDDDEEIYEISLEKSRVQSNVIMSDLFKQLDLDEDLLEKGEGDMQLRKWLLLKTDKKWLTKNARYNLQDKVTFKVIEITKAQKYSAIIEVHKLS